MMTDTREPDDIELIRRCQEGDETAFEALYERYKRQLFSYIFKILGDRRDLAEDVFQQVWLKAVANWHRYNDRQRLLAWLCRIAHNLIMDFYRRQSHMQTMSIEEWDGATYDSPGGWRDAAEGLDQALEDAIQSLPEEQRQVVCFRREGKSFKEIAEIQKSTLNTVLGRMHYAVIKLKAALKDYL